MVIRAVAMIPNTLHHRAGTDPHREREDRDPSNDPDPPPPVPPVPPCPRALEEKDPRHVLGGSCSVCDAIGVPLNELLRPGSQKKVQIVGGTFECI